MGGGVSVSVPPLVTHLSILLRNGLITFEDSIVSLSLSLSLSLSHPLSLSLYLSIYHTHTYTHSLNIYIYIYDVGWKVHRLTKILSWNVTSWGLFFNVIPLAIYIRLPSVLQCLDPIGWKSHQQKNIIWTFQPIIGCVSVRQCVYIYISVKKWI